MTKHHIRPLDIMKVCLQAIEDMLSEDLSIETKFGIVLMMSPTEDILNTAMVSNVSKPISKQMIDQIIARVPDWKDKIQ